MNAGEHARCIRHGDVQVSIKTNVVADLRPYWTWNTKQVFVYLQAEYVTDFNGLNQISIYDRIIQSREQLDIKWTVNQKYRMVDQGRHLRGRQLNMTLSWDLMPRVGMRLLPALRACHLTNDHQAQFAACTGCRSKVLLRVLSTTLMAELMYVPACVSTVLALP